ETMDGAFSSAYKSSLERKGMKRGKMQGIEQEKRETIQALFQMNRFSLQEIATIARCPIEKVQKIQEELEQ
ncbi:hypothetical protein, partial [Dubosiella newyorkensis]